MLGSNNLGQGSVPTAGDNPTSSGTGDVDSVTATVPAVVNNADPANPVINVAAVAPPAVGPSTVGTSNDLARGNHSHGWPSVANIAALDLLSAATMNEGTQVYVASLRDVFELTTSALATTAVTVRNALGAAGKQWLRLGFGSATWAAQTTWAVNTTTGSDEAAGTALAPLLTVSELARRWSNQRLPSSVTVTITGSMVATDLPIFTDRSAPATTVTFTFTPTVIYTSTVTTANNWPAAGAGTGEASIVDAAVPGGSFTAAGALAAAVIGARTNGTACWFWFAKDKGATTARISRPSTTSASATLANGDTYTASTLPTSQVMRFAEQRYNARVIQFARIASGPWTDASVRFERCWINAAQTPGTAYANCAFAAGAAAVLSQTVGARGLVLSNNGMIRGTGAEAITIALGASYHASITGTVVCQGAGINFQSGTLTLSDDMGLYDASVPLIAALYWGVVSWLTGTLKANTNTGLLFSTAWNSLISFGDAPVCVAGSTTNATPIRASGSPDASVANLGNGATVTNRGGNGVFYTNIGGDAPLVAVTGYAAPGAVAVVINNAPAGSPAAPVRYAQIPDGAGGVLTVPSLT